MPDDNPPNSGTITLTMGDLALGLMGSAVSPGGGDAPEADYLGAARGRIGQDPLSTFSEVARAELNRPLGRVAAALSLSPMEQAAVGLAFAVETDPMAGRAAAYLQSPVGGSRPTLGLLARVLAPLGDGPGDLAALAAGPAVRSGLLRLAETGPIPERAVWLSEAITSCLAGVGTGWPGLIEMPRSISADWPGSLAEALAPIAAGLRTERETLLVLRSLSRSDRTEIAARLARALDRRAALFDLEKIETRGLGAFLATAGLLPVFQTEVTPGEYRELPELPGYSGPVIACLGPEGAVGQASRGLTEWSLPLPRPDERARLWASAFDDPAMCADLGREHLQSAGRISEICRYARTEAVLHGKDVPDLDALRAAIWWSDGGGLGALAQPVKDVIPDDTMIMTPGLSRDLGHLLARCRSREKLTETLGGALQARYKVGVRALFVGPSGTGKTLAASWLSGKLTLPLYRVDLAAVSSKYIGETEKNLSVLLAKAEEQDLILLFDEADSLFGKRTDISDSNDRFANAQTNYLLQRIETFSGIVLLTSNAKNRFDEAFTRRIDAIIDFNHPDAEERLALWYAHLGSGHLLAAEELSRLAAFADLTGGHIRNVVLMAAVLAHGTGEPITYAQILEGLRSEYRKLGLTVPSELILRGRAS